MVTKTIRTFRVFYLGFLFVVITTMAAHNHSSTDSSRDTPQEMSKTKTQQLEGSTAAMTSNVTGLNFANFNQDFTCISVGYQNGYRIYNCDPFGRCYEKNDSSIGIVEMLFCSSLLAIVGTGDNPSMSPRRLKIVNTKRQTTICELTFPGTILSIRMNRERLIVLLEETIYIYDITNMRLLHTVEIPPNPSGLFALSSSSENNYLAYPSPQKVSKVASVIPVDITAINAQHPHNLQTNPNNTPNNTHDPDPNSHLHHHQQNSQSVRNGDVIIFNCKTLQPISVIEAHKTQIAAMAFSYDGLLLATASDKGTIIRVFSVETGVKLYQFRRGTYNTKIYSLAFSPDNMFVIASSATETVHIFRLGEEEANNTIIRSKSGGYFNLGLGNASLDAADKILESARQEELSKMMKTRDAKIDSAEGLEGIEVEGDDDAFDDLVADIDHSDSEEEEEGELDVDSDSGDEDEDAGLEVVEGNDILRPLPSDLKKSNTDSSSGAISIFSNVSGSNSKMEPVVDNSRISVARMLRRTSQSLGRKAAEKMGTYLPPKFSSILEPNRHFASLKVPTTKDTTTVVGIGEIVADESLPPSMLLNDETSSLSSSGSKSSKRKGRRRLVHVMVITADGFFYNYGLDTERGGDCVLLNQRSLME